MPDMNTAVGAADAATTTTQGSNANRRDSNSRYTSTGMFAGMQEYKRHPENDRIAERRTSLNEQSAAPGVIGSMFNKVVGRRQS